MVGDDLPRTGRVQRSDALAIVKIVRLAVDKALATGAPRMDWVWSFRLRRWPPMSVPERSLTRRLDGYR